MTQNSIFDWTFLLTLLPILVYWYIVQIRYVLRRYRAKRWPIVNAALQKGAVGRIPVGKGGSIPAAFIG
jgi:hypothetical protein